MLLCGTDSRVGVSLNSTISTTSSQESIVIYISYPHNFHFHPILHSSYVTVTVTLYLEYYSNLRTLISKYARNIKNSRWKTFLQRRKTLVIVAFHIHLFRYFPWIAIVVSLIFHWMLCVCDFLRYYDKISKYLCVPGM